MAETWSQDDMAIIMHNLMKMMDKQNAREYKRAKKEEKRERSRSAKRKSRKEDSDDEQSVDIIGALAQFDLHVNVSRLPATKEIQACVKQARRAVKNGTLPTVGGRLDKRFVPSAQLSSEWAKALDPDRLRLMTFQTLWWGRAFCQLIVQSVTKSHLLTLGQVHDWFSNIQLLAMNEGVPMAMKYDELAWSHLCTRVDARDPTVDVVALLEIHGSTLQEARLLLNSKPPPGKAAPAPSGGGKSSSKGAARTSDRWADWKGKRGWQSNQSKPRQHWDQGKGHGRSSGSSDPAPKSE